MDSLLYHETDIDVKKTTENLVSFIEESGPLFFKIEEDEFDFVFRQEFNKIPHFNLTAEEKHYIESILDYNKNKAGKIIRKTTYVSNLEEQKRERVRGLVAGSATILHCFQDLNLMSLPGGKAAHNLFGFHTIKTLFTFATNNGLLVGFSKPPETYRSKEGWLILCDSANLDKYDDTLWLNKNNVAWGIVKPEQRDRFFFYMLRTFEKFTLAFPYNHAQKLLPTIQDCVVQPKTKRRHFELLSTGYLRRHVSSFHNKNNALRNGEINHTSICPNSVIKMICTYLTDRKEYIFANTYDFFTDTDIKMINNGRAVGLTKVLSNSRHGGYNLKLEMHYRKTKKFLNDIDDQQGDDFLDTVIKRPLPLNKRIIIYAFSWLDKLYWFFRQGNFETSGIQTPTKNPNKKPPPLSNKKSKPNTPADNGIALPTEERPSPQPNFSQLMDNTIVLPTKKVLLLKKETEKKQKIIKYRERLLKIKQDYKKLTSTIKTNSNNSFSDIAAQLKALESEINRFKEDFSAHLKLDHQRLFYRIIYFSSITFINSPIAANLSQNNCYDKFMFDFLIEYLKKSKNAAKFLVLNLNKSDSIQWYKKVLSCHEKLKCIRELEKKLQAKEEKKKTLYKEAFLKKSEELKMSESQAGLFSNKTKTPAQILTECLLSHSNTNRSRIKKQINNLKRISKNESFYMACKRDKDNKDLSTAILNLLTSEQIIAHKGFNAILETDLINFLLVGDIKSLLEVDDTDFVRFHLLTNKQIRNKIVEFIDQDLEEFKDLLSCYGDDLKESLDEIPKKMPDNNDYDDDEEFIHTTLLYLFSQSNSQVARQMTMEQQG